MYCVGIFLTELSHQVRVELERQGYYTGIIMATAPGLTATLITNAGQLQAVGPHQGNPAPQATLDDKTDMHSPMTLGIRVRELTLHLDKAWVS